MLRLATLIAILGLMSVSKAVDPAEIIISSVKTDDRATFCMEGEKVWYYEYTFRPSGNDINKWERKELVIGPDNNITTWVDAGIGKFTVKLGKSLGEKQCQLGRFKNDIKKFEYKFKSDASYLSYCHKIDNIEDTSYVKCGTPEGKDEATCDMSVWPTA